MELTIVDVLAEAAHYRNLKETTTKGDSYYFYQQKATDLYRCASILEELNNAKD